MLLDLQLVHVDFLRELQLPKLRGVHFARARFRLETLQRIRLALRVLREGRGPGQVVGLQQGRKLRVGQLAALQPLTDLPHGPLHGTMILETKLLKNLVERACQFRR